MSLLVADFNNWSLQTALFAVSILPNDNVMVVQHLLSVFKIAGVPKCHVKGQRKDTHVLSFLYSVHASQ